MTTWVVVGAGSAGCVVAGRLAEAGHTVTLVEAGSTAAAQSAAATSFFDALAEPGRVFPGPFVRGRGLGGSGAINGMVATAGDPAQYAGWGWHDAPAAFARIRVPLEQPADDELGPLDRALLAAASDAEPATLTRRAGRRVTAADAYLHDVTVEIIGDAPVARLGLDGRRSTGVVLADGRVLHADRVAVAAGAIGTPELLRTSGIVHPLLGRGPHNHPGLPVTLRLRQDVDVHSLVTASVLRRGDLQVLPLNHLGPATPGHGTLLVATMTPTGTGTVLTDHDRDRVDAGLALVRELLAHAAFTELVADVSVSEAPAGIYHATSTCAMGAVVDDEGLVADTVNVHAVDASVFPDLPSTNTYLPTLMLAERLAARLVDR